MEEKRDRGIPLKTRGHFRLPDCKSLPRYNSSTAADHPTCSYVGLTEMNTDDITCELNDPKPSINRHNEWHNFFNSCNKMSNEPKVRLKKVLENS